MSQQKTQSKSMRLTAMIMICKNFIKPQCIVVYNALCAAGPSMKSWDSSLTQS